MRFNKNSILFNSCIADLLSSPTVQSMHQYTQHSVVSTLEHCLFVSYVSFLVCRFLQWNFYVAARGGLLHDLFLYDWHDESSRGRLHGFTHPKKALRNANDLFKLNPMEQDIILKHMWPLTIRPPKYRESFVVCMADKFCCIAEVMGLYRMIWIRRIMKLHSLAEVPFSASKSNG